MESSGFVSTHFHKVHCNCNTTRDHLNLTPVRKESKEPTAAKELLHAASPDAAHTTES